MKGTYERTLAACKIYDEWLSVIYSAAACFDFSPRLLCLSPGGLLSRKSLSLMLLVDFSQRKQAAQTELLKSFLEWDICSKKKKQNTQAGGYSVV